MVHAKRAIVFLGLALTPNLATPASFDCAVAKTEVEKMVCSDSELSHADADLAVMYQKARASTKDPGKLLADQRKWLRERNACDNKGCLYDQYRHRLHDLAVVSGELSAVSAGPPWIFELTNGSNVPVCRAYLKRLNEGEQANYPFCDRPETGQDFGFVLLNRKALTNEQMHHLGPRARGFIYSRNQNAMDLANASNKKLGLPLRDWLSLDDLAKYLNKDIFVWQYDPPVDIDNDGKPDRLVVWRGHPVGNHLPGCGWMDKWSFVLNDTQMPLFVDESLTRVDEDKTAQVFGHPSGGYKNDKYDGTRYELISNRFRPIGQTIGVFEFDGTYYFDTFFDHWGDFQGQRRSYPWISSLLGVFVRKDGRTSQVCEYRWMNNPNDQLAR